MRSLNLVGARFALLLVVRSADNRIYSDGTSLRVWLCQCDCGNTIAVIEKTLKSGGTKSCGCLKIERFRAMVTKHGKSKSKAYAHWCNMITRCENPDPDRTGHDSYFGMEIGPELRTFEGFYAALGDPSPGMSVDRIDNTKGYVVGNVRWANTVTQQRNKTNNRMLTLNGETRCAAEWCEIKNIPWGRLKMRLKRGWSVDRALTTPPRQ